MSKPMTNADAVDTEAAELVELRAYRQQIEGVTAASMDETCDAGSVHCSCVPVLRAEVNRLRAFVEQMALWTCPQCNCTIRKIHMEFSGLIARQHNKH